MATIYVPQAAEGFEFCHPERQEDFETLNVTLNGTPRGHTWRSPRMRLIREDEGKGLETSDCPWLGPHALIFRRPAIRTLVALLQGYGELLPLTCADAELLVYNVTRVIDALDEAASTIVRFADGRIMRVRRYAFRSAAVSSVDIFKIPNFRVSPTFVSERVVDRWRSAGLRGVDFNRLWSDDPSQPAGADADG